jgi:hypothetical protein
VEGEKNVSTSQRTSKSVNLCARCDFDSRALDASMENIFQFRGRKINWKNYETTEKPFPPRPSLSTEPESYGNALRH